MRGTTPALALLGAAIILAGCNSSGESADPVPSSSTVSSPTTSPTPTPTPTESGASLAIIVVGKSVTPKPKTIDVAPGEDFTLTLTADVAGELHVHAADPELETEVEPGTKDYTFTVTSQPGVYEVELHDPDLLLFEIKVQ